MQALRLQQKSAMSLDPLEEDELDLMTANLLKIKRELTERNENFQSSKPTRDSLSPLSPNKQMNATGNSEVYEQIKQRCEEFLRQAKLPANHEHKLQYLLEEQEMSVGAAASLFEMLYYFRDVISEQVLEQIPEKAFHKIMELGPKMTGAERRAYIELIAMCGVYQEQVISYVVEEMLEGRIEFQLSFLLLSNMGYRGFSLLVNLACEDFKQTPLMILNYLSRTEEIIRQVLIPILTTDLENSKNKGRQKQIILSILNRLNQYISLNGQIFPLLVELMQSNTNDRGFIASVLRSAGAEGEKILLDLLAEFPHNQKLMLPIVSVLPWRPPIDPVLRIKVIQYTLGSNFLPGTLYQYEGNIQPSAFCFEDNKCCDSLCINARDFIAALNRMLSLKLQRFEHEEHVRKGPLNNVKLFALYEVVEKEVQKEGTQISSNVIKALTRCLSNPKAQIREAAINSLGLIGLPEAFESIEQISKCLWDKDSRNRSMSCWAISKICESPSRKIINRLVELLKDSFWKVRISACICIGASVREPYENVIQALVKCLKDSSINKVTVCQTIIKLRTIGEQILLQILRNATANDFKLKEAVIYSLRDSDVKSPHIDFVLEEIFKHCKGSRVETRINCLETLNSLRVKASEEGESIVYLKAKTILPFYYYFLEDPCIKIREMATQSIFSFGGQAQLIFIQGIAKGSQMVRVESAKGLARLGIQNFRALILGLRDEDAQVRQTTTSVILSTFSSENVSDYYSSKPQQVPSLLCNLKDILSNGGLSPSMKTFIKQTIHHLEKLKTTDQAPMKMKYENLKNETKAEYLIEENRRHWG